MATQHNHRSHSTAKSKHAPEFVEKSIDVVPANVQFALKEAMRLEKVPLTDYNDLLWLLAQESGGVVGVHNRSGSTARGLFQITKANYSFNPQGEKSFGNPLEECQGGIRYLYGRYHSAHVARAFWMKHKWY